MPTLSTQTPSGFPDNDDEERSIARAQSSKTVKPLEISVKLELPAKNDEAVKGKSTSSNKPALSPGYLANTKRTMISPRDGHHVYVLRRDNSFVLPQIPKEENKTSKKRCFRSPFIQRQNNFRTTNGFELRNMYTLKRHNTCVACSMERSAIQTPRNRERSFLDFKTHPLDSARSDAQISRRPRNDYSLAAFSARERVAASMPIDREMTNASFKPDVLQTDSITNTRHNEVTPRNTRETSKGIGSLFLQSIVQDKAVTNRTPPRSSRVQKLGHIMSRGQMRTLIYDME